MAFIRIALIAALAVAAFAEPLRYRRQSSATIASAGALAAEGQGAANDAHNAAVIAIGIPASPGSGWDSGSGWGSGWGSDASPGVPASIVVSNAGISEVAQEGSILEVTSNDGNGDLAGLQAISVEQVAGAEDYLVVDASGGEVALGSSSNANAAGEGASAAAGTLEILANSAGSLGMSNN